MGVAYGGPNKTQALIVTASSILESCTVDLMAGHASVGIRERHSDGSPGERTTEQDVTH